MSKQLPIVLIGGSSGIGLATARLLNARGEKLLLASRSPDKLAAAATSIGAGVETRQLDLLNESSVRDFFNQFADHSIAHLFNFAGDSMGGGVLSSDVAAARQAMDSKFWGQFLIGRYAAPKLAPNASLTFSAGSGPRPHQAIATVAANAGVSLLAESLAKELAPIRVNVVAPYYVDSPMWSGLEAKSRDELFARVAQQLPVGFIAKPEQVAPAYVFAMDSPYLTATTIPVNGGALLQTIA